MEKLRREEDGGWVDFDPRARILALFFFVAAVCVLFDARSLAALFAFSLLLAAPSGMTVKEMWKRLLPVNAFMLLIWLTMPFLAGEPYFRVLDFFNVSAPGARQALIVTLKANAIVSATSAMFFPVETGSLAAGLHKLGMPAKLVWLLILSHRYVIGMADKVGKSATAIRMRSGSNGKMRFRAYGGLFAKLFVGGHERGDRLYLAMRSRGYGDVFALRRELRWRIRDSMLTVGMAVLAIAAVWTGFRA